MFQMNYYVAPFGEDVADGVRSRRTWEGSKLKVVDDPELTAPLPRSTSSSGLGLDILI